MSEQDTLPPGFIEELQEIVRIYRETKARRHSEVPEAAPVAAAVEA